MNPLAHVANLGAAVASFTFFSALLLTLWRGRGLAIAAMVLFTIGTWVSLGIQARNFFIMGAIAYGTSDSGSPNSPALFWNLLPLTMIAYALFAPILLWPAIPKATAMRYGIILNLVFVPLLAALTFTQVRINTHGVMLPDELKWLVYALLWFRVRESYDNQKLL